MKRTVMQKVVDRICVDSDYLYEWISGGEVEWKEDLTDLMVFLTEAKEKGFCVEHGCYSYSDKMRIIK